MIATPRPLQPGDLAPFFAGMTGDGRFLSSEDQAGRPAALILAGDRSPADLAPLIQAFVRAREALEAVGADALLLVSAHPHWAGVKLASGAPGLLHCPSDVVFAAAGFSGEPLVLVIDRALRVLERIEGEGADETVHRVLRRLAARPQAAERTVSAPAPVLIVPDLIDEPFRRRLITYFEAGEHVEGAMTSIDAAGQPVSRIEPAKKHRRDCTLAPTGPLHAEVLDLLDRRLLPEIRKAFQAEIAHIDRVLIARYDDTGGFFRRHRDNSAAQVAFRQFALSLNLNTGEYDGGELVFPEFSDDGYAPPAGAACVFSASLLHEARPVTRGSRYVLLSFLHDQAAEVRRRAALARAA